MIRKHCTSCGEDRKHNEMKKPGESRCTFCGHPVSTNAAKRDQQETVRKHQVAKAQQKRKSATIH
jgi:hypothetical protein